MIINPGDLIKWSGTFVGTVRPIGLVLEKYKAGLKGHIFDIGWWVLYEEKKVVWWEDEFEKVNQ